MLSATDRCGNSAYSWKTMPMRRCSGGTWRFGAADRLAVDAHLAGGRLLEAGDQPQCRGLAATGSAQQAADLALGQRERQLLSTTACSAVGMGDAVEFEQRHGGMRQ